MKKNLHTLLIAFAISISLAIFPTFNVFTKAVPAFDNIEQNLQNVVDEVYPEELEITVSRGVASSNVTEPYFLTVKESTIDNLFYMGGDDNAPQNKIRVLTVNTSGKIEDFEKYQSMAMLTSKNLVYYSDEGIQIQALTGVPDTTINRTYLYNKISELSRYIEIIKIFTYVSPIFIVLYNWIMFLLNVLFGAFLLWLVSKILSINIKFRRIYSLTSLLYLVPFAFEIFAVIQPVALYILAIQSLLYTVSLGLGYAILYEYKKEITPENENHD